MQNRSHSHSHSLTHQPLLAQALATVANAIFITDDEGKIIWVNDAFSKLSGYLPEDAIGRTPAILRSGMQEHPFYAQLWETVMGGKVWRGEIVDKKKDGSLYIVEETITPLCNDEGIITNFIAIQHDITAKKQEGEKISHLAYHDGLTGLPNRFLFLETQKKAIKDAERTKKIVAMMFMDLDGFKPINDIYGHYIGDQLLVALAERLQANMRKTDMVARLGGDEFAILVTEIDNSNIAATLARKLLDVISEPFLIKQKILHIRASIGISIYPSDGTDLDLLLTKADQAMYRSKRKGGNYYQFYDMPEFVTPNSSLTD